MRDGRYPPGIPDMHELWMSRARTQGGARRLEDAHRSTVDFQRRRSHQRHGPLCRQRCDQMIPRRSQMLMAGLRTYMVISCETELRLR